MAGMASSTAVMAQVFVGDADDMVDKLIAACQMLPTAVDPGAGMARELVPYFDEGVEADKPATTPKVTQGANARPFCTVAGLGSQRPV